MGMQNQNDTEEPTMTRTRQCKKCPWRKDVDPNEIPNGYCPTKHANLESTIAKPGVIRLDTIVMMACHETKVGAESPCVGWLANQLGPGNNIGLRLWAMRELKNKKLTLIGKQHETFKDTLPKKPRRKRRSCSENTKLNLRPKSPQQK